MANSKIIKEKISGRKTLCGIGVVLNADNLYAVIPLHNAPIYNISNISFGIANKYNPDAAHGEKCTIVHIANDSFTIRYSNSGEFASAYQAQYITVVVDLS